MIEPAELDLFRFPPRPEPRGGDPAEPLRLLLVGAAPGVQKAIPCWTEDLDVVVVQAADLRLAIRRLVVEPWDVVLTVLRDAPRDQLAWWTAALDRLDRRPRFVALVDKPSLDLVLEASRAIRVEVLSLPPSRDEIRGLLTRIREEGRETPVPLEQLGGGSHEPPPEQPGVQEPHALVGESPAMLDVYRLIARVAPSTATVLIEGPSGTGKEVVARFIHAHSPVSEGPFVAVNCAAIPDNLLETELFGHEKGAFTGASGRKIGSFQLAEGGTLFLDEIAEMNMALQAKILRATQEREFQRVGGTDPIRVRVRLIAATNRDAQAAVREGRLREDLYYRLAVVRIRLPPLAARGEDIALLTAQFVREFAARYGKEIGAVSDHALALLRRHPWVGNVRELRNAVERAVLVSTGHTLRAEHLPEEIRGSRGEPWNWTEDLRLEAAEARHIRRVLSEAGGHLGRAADMLGIHRNTLARKLKRIDP